MLPDLAHLVILSPTLFPPTTGPADQGPGPVASGWTGKPTPVLPLRLQLVRQKNGRSAVLRTGLERVAGQSGKHWPSCGCATRAPAGDKRHIIGHKSTGRLRAQSCQNTVP